MSAVSDIRGDHSFQPGNIVDLLRREAMRQPHGIAYTFLADDDRKESTLTYGEVDARARAIAVWLGSKVPPGERALLLYPSGLEFVTAFFGCLYAGITAVPAYPLNPVRLKRTVTRLRALIQDARPVVALTTADSFRLVNTLMSDHADLQAIEWITPERIRATLADDWHCPTIGAEAIAILQYTSGSTRAPRGVMLSHRNVLEIERKIQTAYGYRQDSTFVGWVPLAHDWGLVYFVLQALYVGARSVLMAPESFVREPLRWLRAIARYENVMSAGPNFSYELCVRKITDEQRSEIDLANWKWALIGAEPTRAITLERFLGAFGSCGFRREAFHSAYGLAEATLTVSATRRFQGPHVLRVDKAALQEKKIAVDPPAGSAVTEIVSCGEVLSGEEVAIVDPLSRARCPNGEIGEIWVSGSNVAKGYWNNPEETTETFHAYLSDTQEGPFLRTGDLGFVYEGELFLTARLKDIIIIRGRNLCPQDIEWTVERCHEALRPGCGIAFSVETATEERLVIVQELRDPERTGVDEIITTVRRTVAEEHEISAYSVVLIRPGTIPKTSSGKVRRRDCRTAFLDGRLDVIRAGFV